MCRIVKAPQGSAIFDAVSEEQLTGRVVDRMVPPRGYTAVATSGLIAFEADEAKQQLPFGLADLQVWLAGWLSICLSVCMSVILPVCAFMCACLCQQACACPNQQNSLRDTSLSATPAAWPKPGKLVILPMHNSFLVV